MNFPHSKYYLMGQLVMRSHTTLIQKNRILIQDPKSIKAASQFTNPPEVAQTCARGAA